MVRDCALSVNLFLSAQWARGLCTPGSFTDESSSKWDRNALEDYTMWRTAYPTMHALMTLTHFVDSGSVRDHIVLLTHLLIKIIHTTLRLPVTLGIRPGGTGTTVRLRHTWSTHFHFLFRERAVRGTRWRVPPRPEVKEIMVPFDSAELLSALSTKEKWRPLRAQVTRPSPSSSISHISYTVRLRKPETMLPQKRLPTLANI